MLISWCYLLFPHWLPIWIISFLSHWNVLFSIFHLHKNAVKKRIDGKMFSHFYLKYLHLCCRNRQVYLVPKKCTIYIQFQQKAHRSIKMFKQPTRMMSQKNISLFCIHVMCFFAWNKNINRYKWNQKMYKKSFLQCYIGSFLYVFWIRILS